MLNNGILIKHGKNNVFDSNQINTIINNDTSNIFINNILPGHPNKIPDPTCSNGILNKNVCCESSCGTCGGIGCGARDGLCCISEINTTWKCNNYNAPCIL